MAKKYTVDELNKLSADSLKIVILSMQDQLEQLNLNMERLIEQISAANNQRFGRSSKKLEVIDGQLDPDFIFNEAEALTETLYVVEPAAEDVLPTKKKKQVENVIKIWAGYRYRKSSMYYQMNSRMKSLVLMAGNSFQMKCSKE